MTNKLKNIISNLIGLGVIALGTAVYLNNYNLTHFLALFAVGLSCFLFKISETKAWLNRFLGRVSKDSCNHKALRSEAEIIIGDSPDPNKEEK